MPDKMTYVYRLPDRLSNGYCFGNGVPITFTNVDWFMVTEDTALPELEGFIRRKRYFTAGSDYLVIVPELGLSHIIKG